MADEIRIAETLKRLSGSRFRRSFGLGQKEKGLIGQKGMETIHHHAQDLLSKRVGVRPPNDGKQTPWRGHPVFIAQHATATCCRKCIRKWHGIPPNRPLSDKELDFLVGLVMAWLKERCD